MMLTRSVVMSATQGGAVDETRLTRKMKRISPVSLANGAE